MSSAKYNEAHTVHPKSTYGSQRTDQIHLSLSAFWRINPLATVALLNSNFLRRPLPLAMISPSPTPQALWSEYMKWPVEQLEGSYMEQSGVTCLTSELVSRYHLPHAQLSQLVHTVKSERIGKKLARKIILSKEWGIVLYLPPPT